MRLREQNFKSPSNWFCIPFSESESNTKSSAHSMWAMIFSSIHIPYSGARNDPKSAIYLRNSKPLATPPWLTPNALLTRWLNQPWCLTRSFVLVYKLRRVSMTFPCQPHLIWRHQAITWTNVYSSSVRSSDINQRASPQEIPQPSITEIICRIKYLKFHSNFPGANELILTGSQWVTTKRRFISGAPFQTNHAQGSNDCPHCLSSNIVYAFIPLNIFSPIRC